MQFFNYLVSPQYIGDKIPILCNQENFILKANSYRLFQACPGFQFFINPAVKNDQDRGRPKNGMFICVPNKIKSKVTDVSPGHWRIQAITISSDTARTLVINSYFPFDRREPEDGAQVENDDLIDTLGVIRNIITSIECDAVVWAGDINADFARNNRHTMLVQELLQELNLAKAWDKFEIDFTCVYEREGVSYTSVLDHFFFSDALNSEITEAGVVHHVDNSSDHSPVYCILRSITLHNSVICNVPSHPKPSWRRADLMEKQNFKTSLELRLESIVIPTQVSECKDTHCQDETHLAAVDWFAAELMEGLQDSAEETLPKPKGGKENDQKTPRLTPGFREHVQPAKDTAYFWHCIWKSAGRPVNSELHKIMKKTRNQYHLQFKKCQRSEETIKKSKLLDACLNGNGDLFKEIKSLRKTKPVCADSIDGEKEDIPGHFKNIYSNLYNSFDDAEDVALIREEVEAKISEVSLEDVKKVTADEVKKATERLKPGKSDPSFSFSSDCLKINSRTLLDYLAIMIQSFLIHGHVPQFMLMATLVPIIKDKLSSISSSKNYRSVCITSLVLKLVDWITINLFGSSLGFHKLQFAYQRNVSSSMCTWAVVETVDYFLRNGSEVFGCSMDKSKAFDLTKFSILFRKMFEAKLSMIFLRLIIFTYISQFCNVRWNNQNSRSFLISNGVGQGKILAGYAYCFYCRDLFDLLEKSGYGCRINGIYAGVFGYSDDDFFLSPTTSGLQGMLLIAERFCMD